MAQIQEDKQTAMSKNEGKRQIGLYDSMEKTLSQATLICAILWSQGPILEKMHKTERTKKEQLHAEMESTFWKQEILHSLGKNEVQIHQTMSYSQRSTPHKVY